MSEEIRSVFQNYFQTDMQILNVLILAHSYHSKLNSQKLQTEEVKDQLSLVLEKQTIK